MIFVLANLHHTMFLELCFGHMKDSNAVHSLISRGVADKSDDSAFQQLLECHPTSDPPSCLLLSQLLWLLMNQL